MDDTPLCIYINFCVANDLDGVGSHTTFFDEDKTIYHPGRLPAGIKYVGTVHIPRNGKEPAFVTGAFQKEFDR